MLQQVVRQVLRHALGQSGHEHALLLCGAGADLIDQVVDLALGWLDRDLRIHQAGRANDLLHELAAGGRHFKVARRRRHIDRLSHALLKLIEGQRAVIHRGGKTEAKLHEVALARHVSLKHAANLRHSHVGLIDDGEEVLGEIVQQGRRRRAGRAAVDVARVVLDAGAETNLLNHLQVVFGAHAQALGLQQLAAVLQVLQPLRQLRLDVLHGAGHALRAGHVVGSREDAHLIDALEHVTGERVDVVQLIHVVTKELDAHGTLLISGNDVYGIALDTEGAAGKAHVVALVLNVYQQAQEAVAVNLLTLLQYHGAVKVGLWRAQAVDAGHRGDHDDVAPRQQC